MYYAIDRIEGGIAVLVGEADASTWQLPYSQLPPGAQEGDMLLYCDGAFYPAAERAEEQRAKIKKMLDMLLGSTPGSDAPGEE